MTTSDNHALVISIAASHGDQLRRFLLARVRNPADVPDIAQEVYLRMLRVPNAESIRSPEAYLFTVAQHVVHQHTLRQSTLPPAVELSRLLEPLQSLPDSNPEERTVAQQCADLLQASLDRLAPRTRAAFMLHRRDGLSFDEIGARLGLSRPMVKKHILKALIQLRLRADRFKE